MKIYEIDTFIVQFTLNPTIFQLQHTALDYMQQHNLFDILINNPLYGSKQFYSPPPKSNVPAIQ